MESNRLLQYSLHLRDAFIREGQGRFISDTLCKDIAADCTSPTQVREAVCSYMGIEIEEPPAVGSGKTLAGLTEVIINELWGKPTPPAMEIWSNEKQRNLTPEEIEEERKNYEGHKPRAFRKGGKNICVAVPKDLDNSDWEYEGQLYTYNEVENMYYPINTPPATSWVFKQLIRATTEYLYAAEDKKEAVGKLKLYLKAIGEGAEEWLDAGAEQPAPRLEETD